MNIRISDKLTTVGFDELDLGDLFMYVSSYIVKNGETYMVTYDQCLSACRATQLTGQGAGTTRRAPEPYCKLVRVEQIEPMKVRKV